VSKGTSSNGAASQTYHDHRNKQPIVKASGIEATSTRIEASTIETQVSKPLSKRPNIDANIEEVPKQASLNVMSVNARIERIERIEVK
jgi:hypothetical protein